MQRAILLQEHQPQAKWKPPGAAGNEFQKASPALRHLDEMKLRIAVPLRRAAAVKIPKHCRVLLLFAQEGGQVGTHMRGERFAHKRTEHIGREGALEKEDLLIDVQRVELQISELLLPGQIAPYRRVIKRRQLLRHEGL